MRSVNVLTCVLLVATTAHAQPDDADRKKEADRLFEEGRVLAEAGKLAEACDRFAKSNDLDRSGGTELRLAECQAQLGHLRDAWGFYTAAAVDFEAKNLDKRKEFAQKQAASLEPKMTTMVVKVAQPDLPGLVITINGRTTQPAAEIHEHADPGSIDVIAIAPNLPHFKKTQDGKPGETVTVEIPPLDIHAKVIDRHPPPPPPVLVDGERNRGRVHLAYGLGAGGGVAAGAAIALTLVARSHYNQVADGPHCERVTGGITCDTDGTTQIHNAQRIADYGTVCAIGSAVLLGVAAGVYFTAPRTQVQVSPTATAQSVGLSVTGAF